MSIEADVREIRKLFTDHSKSEAESFEKNAWEHGTILEKLSNIENRLKEGSKEFDALDVRLTVVEHTILNWRSWGAALIFVTGIAVKFMGILFDKIWP